MDSLHSTNLASRKEGIYPGISTSSCRSPLGYLKMVVEVPDSSWLTRSIATCSYPTNKHKDIMKAQNSSALLLDKKNQSQAPAAVKAVEESCVTCGGAHSHRNCPATDGNVYRDNIQDNTTSTSGSGSLPSNTIANPKGDVKAITTRSGVSYNGPQVPPPISSFPKEMENKPEVTKDTVQPSTENIQPPVVQINDQIGEPVVT
ncbi:hypothetical protein Tco_1359472 [Tanacetum coccineum]